MRVEDYNNLLVEYQDYQRAYEEALTLSGIELPPALP